MEDKYFADGTIMSWVSIACSFSFLCAIILFLSLRLGEITVGDNEGSEGDERPPGFPEWQRVPSVASAFLSSLCTA